MTFKDRFYQDLLDNGILYIEGRITEETVELVNRAVLWFEATGKEGRIYFNSRGGSMAAAMDCYDRIKSASVKVTGIVAGSAFSSAAVIFLACHRRLIQQHSELLYHNANIGNPACSQEEAERFKKRCNAFTRKVLHDRMKGQLETIDNLCDCGEAISAQRALELGIVDEIITTLP